MQGHSATPDTVARAVRSSSVAELFWTDPDGAPDGCGVVALTWGEAPVVAFSYAYETRARAVAASPTVLLTLTETRSTGVAFEPMRISGRPRLVEDLDGSVFTEQLLTEELRRYPPARKFADSAMLRREHWWYLPRLIVVLDAPSASPLPARDGHAAHVLAVAREGGLDAHVVRPLADGPDPDGRLGLSAAPFPGSAPAALVGQDASFPDFEQWASWCFRGRCEGDRLRLTQAAPPVGLPPVPSLWQRVREQHAYGRACRFGITRAERRSAR